MNLSEKLKKFGPYLIFFAAMLWATDAPFRDVLTKDLPSNFIVLGEHIFDILIALPILYLGRHELKNLSWKGWLSVLFVAICGSALASIAFTQAFHYVNPSVAILLQKLQPFIAIGLAVTVLQEKLPKNFWAWTLVAVFGAYVISFPTLIPKVYDGEVFNPNFVGICLALLAALFWAASTVFGKYALQSVSFKTVTALRFVVAFLFLILLNFFQGTFVSIASVSPKHWLYMAITAVTSGIVALFIYYKGLENTRASVATIAELGFPLSAVVVNAVVIKAPISYVQILGMFILLATIYFFTKSNTSETQTV